eukprot:1192899-Prorocentrum_minimum.AAC.6
MAVGVVTRYYPMGVKSRPKGGLEGVYRGSRGGNSHLRGSHGGGGGDAVLPDELGLLALALHFLVDLLDGADHQHQAHSELVNQRHVLRGGEKSGGEMNSPVVRGLVKGLTDSFLSRARFGRRLRIGRRV